MFGAFLSPDKRDVNLVLEYMDLGSLADIFRGKGIGMPERILAFITLQVWLFKDSFSLDERPNGEP